MKVFGERDLMHIIFITVYGYNSSILLVVVNLLLCVIYKLYFTIGHVCVQEKT